MFSVAFLQPISNTGLPGDVRSTVNLKPKYRLRSAGMLLFHIAQNMTLTKAEYFSKIFTYIQFQTPRRWFSCRPNLGTSYSLTMIIWMVDTNYEGCQCVMTPMPSFMKSRRVTIVNETRDRHDDAISLCSYTSTYPISLHGVYRDNFTLTFHTKF
jgi:hypothetical protein